jgi:hypothetical protein
MSWTPILQLGSSIKTGKYFIDRDSTTITFAQPFNDTNYTITLTPFVGAELTGIPMAWVITGSLSASSFQIGTSGCDGAYWTATYNLTPASEGGGGGGGGVGPPAPG